LCRPRARRFTRATLRTAQILRLLLAKLPLLGGWVFFPQSAMMSGDAGAVSYRTILRRANQTTAAILVCACAPALTAHRTAGLALA